VGYQLLTCRPSSTSFPSSYISFIHFFHISNHFTSYVCGSTHHPINPAAAYQAWLPQLLIFKQLWKACEMLTIVMPSLRISNCGSYTRGTFENHAHFGGFVHLYYFSLTSTTLIFCSPRPPLFSTHLDHPLHGHWIASWPWYAHEAWLHFTLWWVSVYKCIVKVYIRRV